MNSSPFQVLFEWTVKRTSLEVVRSIHSREECVTVPYSTSVRFRCSLYTLYTVLTCNYIYIQYILIIIYEYDISLLTLHFTSIKLSIR